MQRDIRLNIIIDNFEAAVDAMPNHYEIHLMQLIENFEATMFNVHLPARLVAPVDPQTPFTLKPREYTLREITRDSQNVHTGPVSNQTNTNVQILSDTPVPGHQQTVQEIKKVLIGGRKKLPKYLEDMEIWYAKDEIQQEGDFLYKKVLDGLWARIKSSKNKKELEKRLREELREMNGKCAMGHISRLCNVLVGFDEDIHPEISVGEHLQNKMSAISQKDIPLEEKVIEALELMKELGIPKEEQDAWIDAL